MTYEYTYTKNDVVDQGRYNAMEYHDSWYYGSTTPFSPNRPSTDFLRLRQVRKNNNSVAKTYRDGAVYGPYVSGDGVPVFWTRSDYSSIQDNLRNRALSSFISKVHGRSNANIPLALADLRQTSRMLGSRTIQFLAVVNALRRGKIAKALKYLDIDDLKLQRGLVRNERKYRAMGLRPDTKLANHWLELWFGAVPLLSDIYNLVRILEDQVMASPSIVEARSSAKQTLSFDKGVKCSGWNSPSATETYFNVSTTLRYGFSGRYAVTDPGAFLLKSLGLSNPYYVVYDLIPLSFVAGWFTNIGSYLKQYDFDAGLQPINLSQSFLLKESGSGNRYKYGWWCLSGSHSVDYFQRIAYPDLSLQLSTNYANLLDLWKSITAMALISQRIK